MYAPSQTENIGLCFIHGRALLFVSNPFFCFVGAVTSGIPSPTLGKNIAMAYVTSGWHKKGTQIEVDVRNKLRPAVVTPMPFIKPNYWRG